MIQKTKEQHPSGLSQPQRAYSDFEDSDDEDENEVEQKPLIAPSTDIKEDFEAALEEGFEFDGVFAYSQRYAIGDALNPCLNVDGLGAVGIPLSEREARAIIAVTLTGDCANTTGIWELPAEKIRFSNPAWDTWIQKTAGAAASTALTAYTDASPSFALKKLVVQETSAHTTHYKEPIDDDESNVKIGDFIVVLPSTFEGAQLQLRHAGQTKSLNFSHQSGLSTSVIAAYSGVEHTLSAVSSGYRLSLVYDIVQPVTHAEFRPTLPEMQGATQKLHNIMLSWKQDATGEAPQFLACLLQHKYGRTPDFRAKSLTGVDALLMSHLHPLARELKFRTYLAHIDLTITIPCEADDDGYEERRYGYGGGWGRRGRYAMRLGFGYDDGYDEGDIDEAEFEDNEAEIEESLVVTHIVDLRGMPVAVDLNLLSTDLINGVITDQVPDKELFERDERTTATRTKVYKRTVLLIWPKDGHTDCSVSVGNVYDYACNALKNSVTVSPTKREKKLVDQLLDCCRAHPQEAELRQVLQVLRESADRWNDVDTLLRTMRACGVEKNTDLMGLEAFVSAYQAFGWAPLKDFYTEAMAKDESNARRQALLARLRQMAADEQDEEVAAWSKEQVERSLHSLSKIDAAQIPWLTAVGLSRGGKFLRDVIFPQLHAQKLDQAFWIPFIEQLQLGMADIPTTSPAVVQSLIAKCVTETVRTLTAFPIRVIPKTHAYDVDREDKNSNAVLEVIKLCITTKNDVLCGEVFKKMREAAARGTYSPSFPPWLYYTELSPALVLHLQSVPLPNTLDLTFRPFFFDVIDSLVSAARVSPTGKAIAPCPLTDQHNSVLMMLNATTLKGHHTITVQALVRSIVQEFSPKERLPADSATYAALVVALVRIAIHTFDTAALAIAVPYSWYYAPAASASDQMIRMVQFCFDFGALNSCQLLFLRLLPPPPASTVAQQAEYVSTILAPFLPVLQQYLVSKRLDLQTEPFKTFAAAVVKSFAEKVMVPKPSEVVPAAQLQAIGCGGCEECRQLRAFFLSEQLTISFARAQVFRTHLERQLSAISRFGVSYVTIKQGVPHTLKVCPVSCRLGRVLLTYNSLSDH
ncbi:hypothetical protein C8R46DRAFT_285837 [Mycena filopes]|nr:hypothetical protein C8R46DRAFT_285837 [Mycena filopes]